MERFYASISDWLLWVVGSIIAGSMWATRRILTNEKEIELVARAVEYNKRSLELAHRRLDEHHKELVKSNEDLRKAIEKQADSTSELYRYLRDTK